MTSSIKNESDHQNRFLGIPWIEWILVCLFFGGLFLVLAKFSGGPLVSDDFYYMDAGLNGYKAPLVFFYYTHIYFQRIIMELAPTPLAGAKYYWAFLISITSAGIYISSRFNNNESRWLNAVLGTMLFISLSFLSKYSGITKNDLTAMMILTVITVVYTLAARNNFRNQFFHVILGTLFFFACKSKETVLLAGYLFLGLGFVDTQKYSIRYLLKRISYLIFGFVLGIGIFIFLNLWIVGDPLWGIRPTDLLMYIGIRGNNMSFPPFTNNFLSGEMINKIAVPFFLYLIVGVTRKENHSLKPITLLWTYPLVLVVFLTLTLIFSSSFSVTDRFFFPALPILCIFASQVISFVSIQKRTAWIQLGIIVSIGLIISIILTLIMTKTNTITGYKWEDATLNIIQPIFLSVFIISVAWKKPCSIRSMMVPLICIIVLIFQPLYLNYRSIVIDQPNNKNMAQLLYPLSAFSNEITDFSGSVFYISPNINKEYQMLSRHTDEIRSMFNVYFHQGLETDAFINLIIFKPGKGILIFPDPLETLPEMNYDYAIITSNDWGRILRNPELLDLFQRYYEITFDDQDTIGLLSKKVK